MKNKNVVVTNQVILNLIQDLQRLLLQLINNMRGRCQIKFGMTSLCNNGGRRGFTLIELLVVVLIIGILSAVALPQYQKAVKKAQGREALVAIDALDKAVSNYYLENGSYEGITPNNLNIDLPELKHFRFQVGCLPPMEGSFFWLDTDQKVHTYIWSKSTDATIDVLWYKGEFLRPPYCRSSTGSCSEHFDCLSGGKKVWTGSSWSYNDCTLK